MHYTDRGGEVTFHGPGQWVCYPIYHLRELNVGARTFIRQLESSMIATVGAWGLQATGDIDKAAGVRFSVLQLGVFIALSDVNAVLKIMHSQVESECAFLKASVGADIGGVALRLLMVSHRAGVGWRAQSGRHWCQNFTRRCNTWYRLEREHPSGIL